MRDLVLEGWTVRSSEAGAGRPLVLVHGTLQDQRYWAPQMEAFGARFHVHALSLRHYWPDATDGSAKDFTIARHVADVALVLRALGGRPALVGHSRGGHVAFRVASEYPDLVGDLVLAEPGGELDETLGGVPPSGAQAAGFARAAAAIAEGRVEDGLRMFAEGIYGPNGWERWSEARRRVALDNVHTLVAQRFENRLPFSREAARAITARTLLIRGDQTRPTFTAIVDALAAAIPDARQEVIANAGHAMSSDNPGAFNAAVLMFLTSGQT